MTNRAAFIGVTFLGGALGLILYLVTRGLPEEAREAARTQIAALAEGKAALAAQAKALKATVATDPEYLAGQPEVKAAFAAAEAREKAIEGTAQLLVAEIEALLKEDAHGDRATLQLKVDALRTQALEAKRGIAQEREAVDALVGFKANHAEILEGSRAVVTTARGLLGQLRRVESPIKPAPEAQPAEEAAPEAALEALKGQLAAAQTPGGALYHEVTAAKAACPNAAGKIQKRYEALKALAESVVKMGGDLEAQSKVSPVDYAACGRLSLAINSAAAKLTDAQAKLDADLKALGRSEDKILVDMRESPSPAHKYKHVLGADAKTTDWVPVSSRTYKAHEDHLGMALESKPECVLPEDATKIASPPGYAYVGNPRYGRWGQHNGARVWLFHSHYSMHRDRLWGSGYYKPVSHKSWSGYEASRKAKKPYFGAQKQYGTQGSYTKKRFSSSAYATATRAKARKGYRGSSYSGGSKSKRGGSFRSSRYSSSSFGGSGK